MVGGASGIGVGTAIQNFFTQKLNPNPQPNDESLTYKSGVGIMSGDELIKSMGKPPMTDVTFFGKTIKTNSVEYKEALGHLNSYQSMAKAYGDLSMEMFPGVKDAMKGELQKVVDAADKYIAEHSEDEKADRRNVMANLKQMALDEMAALDKLDTMTNLPGEAFISEGIAFVRVGMDEFRHYDPNLCDSAIDHSKSKEAFASGALNTVSLLVYGDEARIVKPLEFKLGELEGADAMKTIGIDNNEVRQAPRNIASSVVAQNLGFEDLLPMPSIVVHGDKVCLAMPVAPGESTQGKVQIPVTDKLNAEFMTDCERTGDTAQLKAMSASRNENGDWVKSSPMAKGVFTSGNTTLNASLAKGMLDLQVLDGLCGQADRHSGNIYVRIEGDTAIVTGIDNDLSFGENSTHLEYLGKKPENQATAYQGAPPLMSRDMYNALKGMDRNAYEKSLDVGLSQAERAAAMTRFDQMVLHADNLANANCIVDDFATWTGADPKSGNQVDALTYLKNTPLGSYVQVQLGLENQAAVSGQLVPLDPAKHG